MFVRRISGYSEIIAFFGFYYKIIIASYNFVYKLCNLFSPFNRIRAFYNLTFCSFYVLLSVIKLYYRPSPAVFNGFFLSFVIRSPFFVIRDTIFVIRTVVFFILNNIIPLNRVIIGIPALVLLCKLLKLLLLLFTNRF